MSRKEAPVKQNVYTCQEYREEMILLALRQRLERHNLSPEERREIEQQIKEIEEKMGL